MPRLSTSGAFGRSSRARPHTMPSSRSASLMESGRGGCVARGCSRWGGEGGRFICVTLCPVGASYYSESGICAMPARKAARLSRAASTPESRVSPVDISSSIQIPTHVSDGRELHQIEQAIGPALECSRMHAAVVSAVGQQACQVEAETEICVAAVLSASVVTACAIPERDFEIAQEPVRAQRRKTIGLGHEQIPLLGIIAKRIEIRR